MTDHQPSHSGWPAHLLQLIRSTVPPMHPAGRPFVIGAGIASLLLRLKSRRAGMVGALVTAWCAWFFRQPRRTAPSRPNVVVSAADGEVSTVEEASPPPELGWDTSPRTRVSVFLTIFDVHVQRMPVTGTVAKVAYRPGAFLSADLDKASEDNERNSILVADEQGREVAVVQIAGLIARRIVCEIAEHESVLMGQTYGLIRFGSRVDVYLPRECRVLVEPGQRVVGGETVLAEFPQNPEQSKSRRGKASRAGQGDWA